MQITPQVHIVERITRPQGGWNYARPSPRRLTSKYRFHHQRYGIYLPVVIISNGGFTLFDTGTPGCLPRIEECVESLGFRIDDLKSIVISHAHVDHIGELKHLVELTGTRVYAHEAEIPYLLKKKVQECDSRQFEVTNIDGPLKDGETLNILGGVKVIHTPGHTPGHISLYAEKEKILFAVDLLRHSRGEIHLPPPEYSVDYSLLVKSLVRICHYDFNTLVLYHGEPILGGAREKVSEFVEYLKAISDIFVPSIRDALASATEE